ncbi:hypothetical protein SAMN05192535_3997 [Shouchella rhizosphaerae]|nr:hypothetical protein SAMN05192535_3997 [Shouchella rhizosphaerae]
MLGISKFRLMLVETKRMIILDLFNQFKKSLAFLKDTVCSVCISPRC